MPWSVPPLRIGRTWPLGPDAAALRARWDTLVRAADESAREALFQPTRFRGLHTAVSQLPGHTSPTAPLAAETGPCPEPLRVLHGPFDLQWLIPDHRLIDAARPELWRVADEHQIHAVELGRVPQPTVAPAASGTGRLSGSDISGSSGGSGGSGIARDPGPAVVFSALLPDGRSPAGRPCRIRPLFRRPGGREPNLSPGLLDELSRRLDRPVSAQDFLAWVAAAATRRPDGCAVPLPLSPELWDAGTALGRRILWLHTHGARCAPSPGDRPKLPGGQRPYVRAAIPSDLRALPATLHYDPDEQALGLGEGLISPVPGAAWDFHAGGVRVLEHWYERRTAPAAPGTLDAARPATWPREWTSDLLELITVLALLAELRPEQHRLAARLAEGPLLTGADLGRAGVLPAAAATRRPASVLDHHEEGPNGQFALI
ncbi:type ISP restriction/modification enzyme [Streptomyces sp. NPDC004647]|uniref:type ISP restriction/modification enzyme n=1 Tax=Streptomyces sp. NPDC004647 TaxID=3154671 RepID=UPI0033B2D928